MLDLSFLVLIPGILKKVKLFSRARYLYFSEHHIVLRKQLFEVGMCQQKERRCRGLAPSDSEFVSFPVSSAVLLAF